MYEIRQVGDKTERERGGGVNFKVKKAKAKAF